VTGSEPTVVVDDDGDAPCVCAVVAEAAAENVPSAADTLAPELAVAPLRVAIADTDARGVRDAIECVGDTVADASNVAVEAALSAPDALAHAAESVTEADCEIAADAEPIQAPELVARDVGSALALVLRAGLAVSAVVAAELTVATAVEVALTLATADALGEASSDIMALGVDEEAAEVLPAGVGVGGADSRALVEALPQSDGAVDARADGESECVGRGDADTRGDMLGLTDEDLLGDDERVAAGERDDDALCDMPSVAREVRDAVPHALSGGDLDMVADTGAEREGEMEALRAAVTVAVPARVTDAVCDAVAVTVVMSLPQPVALGDAIVDADASADPCGDAVSAPLSLGDALSDKAPLDERVCAVVGDAHVVCDGERLAESLALVAADRDGEELREGDPVADAPADADREG
jgi:hypothetical protein